MNIRDEIVRGQPLPVAGRTLVPIARRTVGVRRQAFIGPNHTSAQVHGQVRLRPLGIVEAQAGQERLFSIPDRTGDVLRGLAIVALAAPLLLLLVERLARR